MTPSLPTLRYIYRPKGGMTLFAILLFGVGTLVLGSVASATSVKGVFFGALALCSLLLAALAAQRYVAGRRTPGTIVLAHGQLHLIGSNGQRTGIALADVEQVLVITRNHIRTLRISVRRGPHFDLIRPCFSDVSAFDEFHAALLLRLEAYPLFQRMQRLNGR